MMLRRIIALLALAARARARYSETTAGAVPQWQCGSNRACTVNGFDKDKPEIVIRDAPVGGKTAAKGGHALPDRAPPRGIHVSAQ